MIYRKQCPGCRSPDITLYAGGITGVYQCRKCGYVGPVVAEVSRKSAKRKKRAKKRMD